MMVAALALMTFAMGNAKADDNLGLYPEFAPMLLNFTACSQNGHEVQVQFKILNFSTNQLTLPNHCRRNDRRTDEDMRQCGEEKDGKAGNWVTYSWATKEENAAAALPYFTENFRKHIKDFTDDQLDQDGSLGEIALEKDVISGELDDGSGRTGDWPVSVSLKTMLQTQMKLAETSKFSGMRIYFLEKDGTFARVNRDKSCTLKIN
jgi:hypothetical protein